MIQLVRNHRIFRIQQCLEQPAIRIETRSIKDRIFRAKERRQPLFQLFMNRLRPTNKPNARHPIAPLVQSPVRRFQNRRMIRQPQIVVGAHVQDFRATRCDFRLLRTFNHTLALEQTRLLDAAQLLLDKPLIISVHT